MPLLKLTVNQSTTVALRTAIISFRSDNIIEVQVKDNMIINKEDAEEMVNAFGVVGNGQKYPVLIIAGEYALPEAEARPYIASEEANRYTSANAFVIKNLAQKLVGNVYLKIDRPVTPTKFFTDETEALKWLSKFTS